MTKVSLFDKNLLGFEGASDLNDTLENTMITDLKVRLRGYNLDGIQKYDLDFIITNLDMGRGQVKKYITVFGLNEFNANSMIECIEYRFGKIERLNWI